MNGSSEATVLVTSKIRERRLGSAIDLGEIPDTDALF